MGMAAYDVGEAGVHDLYNSTDGDGHCQGQFVAVPRCSLGVVGHFVAANAASVAAHVEHAQADMRQNYFYIFQIKVT